MSWTASIWEGVGLLKDTLLSNDQPTFTVSLVFLLALGFVLSTTPLFRSMARKSGFMNQPKQSRFSMQAVPLLGGLAIYLGVLLAVLLVGRPYLREMAGLLIGGTVLMISGLLDDRFGLAWWVKLLLQWVVCSDLFAVDIRVDIS